MDIVTLAERFVSGLVEIQEDFTENQRLDQLESRAVELGNRTVADFIGLTLSETDQLICDSGIRKRDYSIQRHDERTLITTAGDATFIHTLFRSKKDGSYHFLLDEWIGLPDHERLSEQAEAKILSEAEKSSYQKAADALKVGDQTISKVAVMEKVHAILDKIPQEEPVPEKEKKWCEYLYIEADEDHIHEQGGDPNSRGFQGKLIYLFEGKEDVCKGKRKLVHPYFYGGLYRGSPANQAFWEGVQKYIEEHYNVDVLKTVYINSDCAAWIKAGADYIDKSVLVADRFHLMKYINRVANLTLDDAGWVKGKLYKYIYQDKLLAAKKLLTRIRNHCGGEAVVEECRTYFINNWEAIRRAFRDKHVLGCSAEGHVSSVYSDRMSSRPMGWSETGSDAMCRLRCYTRNYGHEKIIDLVRYRRQKALEELAATGTEGIIESVAKKTAKTKAQKQLAGYVDWLHASIGGITAKKTLAIRRRLDEI